MTGIWTLNIYSNISLTSQNQSPSWEDHPGDNIDQFPCTNDSHLQDAAQNPCSVNFLKKYLQRWRLHSLSSLLVSVLSHPHNRRVFLCFNKFLQLISHLPSLSCLLQPEQSLLFQFVLRSRLKLFCGPLVDSIHYAHDSHLLGNPEADPLLQIPNYHQGWIRWKNLLP